MILDTHIRQNAIVILQHDPKEEYPYSVITRGGSQVFDRVRLPSESQARQEYQLMCADLNCVALFF